MFDNLEISAAPQIRRLDVVVGVGVEALVGHRKFIELVNPQKNRLKLSRIFHERIERSVTSIFCKPQRIVGTVRRQARATWTSPPILPRGSDRTCKVLHPGTNLVVRGI